MTEMTSRSRCCPKKDLQTEAAHLIESGIEGDPREAVNLESQRRHKRGVDGNPRSAGSRVRYVNDTAGMSIRTATACPSHLHGW